MRRALLLLLLPLLGLAAAQGVPNTFGDGSTMSAAAMNANLEWVSNQVENVRQMVIQARGAEVAVRDRASAIIPIVELTLDALWLAGAPTQQADGRPWPFEAGDLVDANAVNVSFATFVSDSQNIDAFYALIVDEMTTISEGLSAAEQEHGLPDGAREAALPPRYVAPSVNLFAPNQRIVAAEVNENFTRIAASLITLEQAIADLDAWVEHELERLELLEAVAGPSGLTEEAYVIHTQGVMDPSTFDERTEIWAYGVYDVSSDGSYRTAGLLDGPFYPAADGAFDVVVDARTMADQGLELTPAALVDYLIPNASEGSTRTLFVSNPSAVLYAVSTIVVFQQDPAGSYLASHVIDRFAEEEEVDAVGAATLVFSDRALSIVGRLEEPAYDDVWEVNVRLNPGWNLLYSVWDSARPEVDSYRARGPEATDEVMLIARSAILGWFRTVPDIYGYSLFSAHEFADPETRVPFRTSSYNQPVSNMYLRVPAWLDNDEAPALLTTVDQAVPDLPGLFQSDDPDARFLVAQIYAFDQAATEAGLLDDVSSSLGMVVPSSSTGHAVEIVYVDRTNTVTVDYSLGDDGERQFRTLPGGMELRFGWNFIEGIPDPDDPNIMWLGRLEESWPRLDLFMAQPPLEGFALGGLFQAQ